MELPGVPSALYHPTESECREMMKGVTLVCAGTVAGMFRSLSSEASLPLILSDRGSA